jgi:hypothetical protein
VIWRLTAVWAWATAAPDASAKPSASVPIPTGIVPMGLIAKPPVFAKQWPNAAPQARFRGRHAGDFGT